METKIKSQLEEARALFYSGKLPEAYRIFRRYFDSLPFNPQEGHAENFALFVRLLLELGKDEEMKFYEKNLERACAVSSAPAYRYAMAMSHVYAKKWDLATGVLENILRDASAHSYHAKAKMVLANCYEVKGDIASIRYLIDSIDQVDSPEMMHLLVQWKAHVARLEKNFPLCHKHLCELFSIIGIEKDWYAYFCGFLTKTLALIDEGRMKEARTAAVELRKSFEGRNYRVVQLQISTILKSLEQHDALGVLTLSRVDGEFTLDYGGAKIRLDENTSIKKLFLLFLKKRSLDKKAIVQTLYGREYQGKKDDAVIYYQVHVLRKWLKQKGIPEETVKNSGDGYRLVPNVQVIEEKNT